MKKYVIAGCGNRGINAYAIPLVKDYSDVAELVGVFDVNYKRAEAVSELSGRDIPVFRDFDEMLNVAKPDVVIVTTTDATHDHYAIRAMESGCDVISEKPLTTTPKKALAIMEAEERTGRKVTVTFNLRFSPELVKLKETVKSGVIGEVHSVHYQWMLDTDHGADYFRRWHRRIENSGSLSVHKATHHFDLINWFLEDEPELVNAFGSRRTYGHTRDRRAERCLDCPYKDECEYYYDIEKRGKRLYLDCEDVDGYYRDACIFADEINIQDNLSLNVKYKRGAIMSYTLTAHSPYEGFNIVLNGERGRIEFSKNTRHSEAFAELSTVATLRVFTHSGEVYDVKMPTFESEGHGGADKRLRDNLFRGFERDELCQMADVRAGLMSIGIGMAANASILNGKQVAIKELYENKI